MGSRDFNPKLIVYEIIAIQSLFYLLFASVLEFFHYFCGLDISYDLIFTDTPLTMQSYNGILLIVSFLLSFLCGGILIASIIQKAKKCLDYGCTLLILHFFFTIWHQYTLPSNITWYITLLIGGIGMVLLAEYLCVKIEMQEIPIAY